jgi:glycerol-3-phosphate dehydrogenase subunit C
VFFFAPGRWLMDRMLGIAQNAPFPHFASQKFSTWFNRRQPVSKGQRKVVYFHGCSTEYYEPRIGKAAVHVLEANGFEVIVPEQNCCGLPLLSNGEFNTARRYHESNIRHFSKFARQGIPIVGTSTSCTLTLKEEAPELLDMQDEDTLLFARMTYDLNEFLLILYDEGSLNLDLQPISLELPYHVPCQYRAHRLGFPGMEILELIPGLRINESQAVCCGIAGTYGYKSERYEIAMQVGKPLFEFILSADAPLVVCDSETCRWQITHATQKKSIHPIELLALSYGYKPEGPLEMLINRV